MMLSESGALVRLRRRSRAPRAPTELGMKAPLLQECGHLLPASIEWRPTYSAIGLGVFPTDVTGDKSHHISRTFGPSHQRAGA